MTERERSATSSRSVAAARAAAVASLARASSSAGVSPPRRAIARASSSSLGQRLDERGRRLLPEPEPLAGCTEGDEAAVGAFLATGRAGQRGLDTTTLGAKLGQA